MKHIAILSMIILASSCSSSDSDSDNSNNNGSNPTTRPNNAGPLLTIPVNWTVDENTTALSPLTANDKENDPLTFSLKGVDAAAFSITNASTGEWQFVTAPDYEMPNDANKDRVYEVTVVVSDGDLDNTRDITITVSDVAGAKTSAG